MIASLYQPDSFISANLSPGMVVGCAIFQHSNQREFVLKPSEGETKALDVRPIKSVFPRFGNLMNPPKQAIQRLRI